MSQSEFGTAERSNRAIRDHVKAMLRKLLDRLQSDAKAGAAPQIV